MSQMVFVSYVDDDYKYKSKMTKWAKAGTLGQGVTIVGAEDLDVWDEEDYLIPDKLAWKLKEASFVIVLVGTDMHDHPWLEWEGEFCHQWGIKRFLMRIPYTEGKLPAPFATLTELAYNPNAIEKQLRGPGKTGNFNSW